MASRRPQSKSRGPKAPAGAGDGEPSGLVYGVALRGRLPRAFVSYLHPLPAGAAAPADVLEVSFCLVDALPEVEEIWSAEEAAPGAPSGGGRFALWREPGGFGLAVSAAGRGRFRCSRRAMQAEWTAPGTAAPHHLFSYALPLWLESRGAPVLHGSAVALSDRAVGFLGASGSGKSVLAAELARLGCAPLADDGLVLRRDATGVWRTFHGPPLVRLWPGGLARLRLAADPLPRVHEALDKRLLRWREVTGVESAGAPAGVRLAALYLLERRAEPGGAVTISPLAAREAMVRLLEHGVAAAPAAALGWAGRRFERLADAVTAIPVCRLSIPGGDDSARRVRDAIARDLGV